MRLLDLFCGAGGAAVGYSRALPGIEIVGVDIAPQPRYPFDFVQADAMTFDVAGFDIVHASPPCTDFATVSGRSRSGRGGGVGRGGHGTGWLLDAVAARLVADAPTWVLENVMTAPMPERLGHAFTLCGSSFGLDLRRHRRFVTSVAVSTPLCDHSWQTPRFVSLDYKLRAAGRLASVVGVHGSTQYPGDFANRCRAMGIDWMKNAELTQAIPPAYTEHIGRQLIAVTS